MYITLYKNNLATVFYSPAAAPDESNYLQILEGSRKSLWQCTRTGSAGGWSEISNPGGIHFACTECPPTAPASPGTICTCTIGYQRWYQYIPETYVYSWTKVQDGYPEIVFGGIVKEVKEDITKRVYDKDKSTFEGLADETLDEPLIFVVKEDDGTYVYSGYVNSWSQDAKVCRFKGLDFKTILDTDVSLDFYADVAEVNLQVSTILNKVFDAFDNNQPPVVFNVPSITTDTAYITNFLGQVFTTNALKFIKVYLATAGLFMLPFFNEISKEIEMDVTSTNQAATIHLDDFVHESTKTDTKTNKCIATVSLPQDSEDTPANIQWIRSSKAYYDSLPSNRKKQGEGVVINESEFIRFPGSNWGYFESEPSSPNKFIKLTVYQSYADFNTILTTWSKKFILHIPYHPNLDMAASFMRENGSGSAYFNNTRQMNTTVPVIEIHPYTDFGQGWFIVELKGTYPVPYAYYEIFLKFKGVTNPSVTLGTTFKNELANKVIFAKQTSIQNVRPYEFGKTYQQQPWYMYPKEVLQYDGDYPPYGDSYRTFYNSYDHTFTALTGTHTLVSLLGSCPIDTSRIKVYLGGDLVFDGVNQYGALEYAELINCSVDVLFGFQGGEQFYFYFDGSYVNDYYPSSLRIVIDEIEVYWQVGQIPREPKPVPSRNYFLGKDNEIYEQFIAPANQIFPVQQKIIAEEFFYKAQFNAVYELVNSRFNQNIIVIDNSKVNPLELSNLGLNAQITVYDKLNNVAILPVSEIEIRNGKKSVKLGFKKIFLTEVIKG